MLAQVGSFSSWAAMADGVPARARTSYEAYIEDHLHRMHHEIEVTTRKLELEKRRLAKLEEDCRRAKSEYEDKVMLKRKDDKHGEEKETSSKPKDVPTTAAMIKAIEYKLDKAIGKYNLVNHENKELRERINEIRRERIQLNQVFRKSIEDIRGCTKGIFQIKSEEDEAKNVVEDIKVRISTLAKQRDRGRKGFGEEVERLKIQTKKEDREKKETEVKMKRDADERDKDRRKYLIADEELNFSEATMMKRILKLAFLNTIQRRHIKQHQKNIEIFEQAFATIKSTTGISDIEEIVRIFVKLEERNFSLLTYVNQLNREIESIDLKNRDLKAQRDEHRSYEETTREKKDQLVSSLERQMQQTVLAQEDLEQDIKNKLEVLEAIRPQCIKACEQLQRTLGRNFAFPNRESSEITEFLTYIEKQVLLQSDNIPADAPMKVIKAPPTKRPLTLKPPELSQFIAQQSNLDDEEEDDEEGVDRVMPMSRVDLKAAAERSIAKRRKGRAAHRKPNEQSSAEQEEQKDTLTYDSMVEKSDTEGPRRGSFNAQDGEDEDVDRKWRKDKA